MGTLLASPVAEARVLHLGLSGGINASALGWSGPATAIGPGGVLVRVTSNQAASGIGYMAGASLSFFQDYLFGVHLVEDLLRIQAASSSGTYVSNTWVTAVIPALHFEWMKSRHSIGIGYARGFNSVRTADLSGLSVGTALDAIAVEGKDSWKIGSSSSVFLAARGYVWLPKSLEFSSFTTLGLCMGIDF